MHHPEFQKLEGTWRGLNYLVMNSETSASLKLKVLNIPKKELYDDLDKAVEFDQSQIFKKIYETEFGSPGGEPYGALIGDYEFTNHPEDIDLLGKMSNVAAGGLLPVRLRGVARALRVRELGGADQAPRPGEDLPGDRLHQVAVLPRLGGLALRHADDAAGAGPPALRGRDQADRGVRLRGGRLRASRSPHDQFTWMNAAYVLGTRMTDAFAKYGFCTAIRGAEGGGKVEGLPAFVFTSDDGDRDLKCPTEIGITDRRENELSKLGFLPLCHYKNTDYAVFFGGQTTQKPKKYDRPEATANAAISARLPYIMATSRFAHYLKVMARDWIGCFKEAAGTRDRAEPLDQELRQRQRRGRPGDEGQVPAPRGQGRGPGDPRRSRAPTTRSPGCGPGSSSRS